MSIKMPDNVVLDEATYTNTYGKFTVQPLERGFGVTLGNSLRRVLLSSLTGSAITSITMDGALHEFSTITGVLEDVSEVILNLKQVRLKLLSKKTAKAEVILAGEGVFTAGEIQKNCPDVEILNPDLHIATLNKDAKLKLEVRFGTGRGYVPSTEHKHKDALIGLISVDSIFTPLKNVRYDIENVRIGDRNDFEKLTLEIETDGSITPEDALTAAAKILRDHLQLFINFDVEQEEEKPVSEKDTEKERIKKVLLTSVEDLELSVRSYNCLKAANIKTLSDLVRKQESDLLKFKNFGRKSLAELTDIVSNFGLRFGMDVDYYINDKSDNN